MRDVLRTIVLAAAGCLLLAVILGWGKPAPVIGLFLVSGLAVGSLYALGGIGMVLLFRATGVLNLAAGAIGAGSAFLTWQLGQWGLLAPLTWVAGLLTGAVLALAYGRLIAPGLSWREPVIKGVASLGYALILLGLVSFLWNDDPRKLSFPTDAVSLSILGLKVTVTRMIVMGAAIGIVIAITLALNRTRIGLQMRALANNRRIASLVGVPILRVETVAWGVSGLIFGFTGLMFGSLVRLEPAVITFMVIPCTAAAIAGRLVSLPNVLIAGLAMGVIESLLTLSDTFKSVRPMAPYVIAIAVLVAINLNRRLTFSGED
jgi:branched-chain amino acid transport system permease protein